jgi:hypothetical protein
VSALAGVTLAPSSPVDASTASLLLFICSMLKRMSHDNVVAYVDSHVVSDGGMHIVMEFVEKYVLAAHNDTIRRSTSDLRCHFRV